MYKKYLKFLPLFVSVLLFLSFGIYNISKFETTDEHFWKYDRIEKYINAIKEHDIKKTRINDKPGVTVALTSGIGMLFGPSPNEHIDIAGENTHTYYDEKRGKDVKMYDMFHTDITTEFNYALRLPILLFNALLILPLIFFLTYQITKNYFIAGSTILLVGLSPTLIGISRIINPDSLLWGTSAVALLSFIALTYTQKKYLIFITGLATGAALLSKYTANLLFLLYPLFFFLYAVFNDKITPTKELIITYTKNLALIVLTSFITFAVFLPAVFNKPSHFLYGTLYSPPFEPIVNIFLKITNLQKFIFITESDYKTIPMLTISFATFATLTVILPSLAIILLRKRQIFVSILFKTGIGVMVLLFIFSLLNAWTHESIIQLNDLKETSRVGDEMLFPQFSDNATPIFFAKALLVQSQNLIFSLTPLNFVLIFFLWILTLFNKLKNKKYESIIYSLTIFPFIFFIGGLFADIFVNIRYGIMLYVPYIFLSALGLHELLSRVNKTKQQLYYIFAFIIIIIIQVFSLWLIKPHYFTYLSFFLPKEYSVTDTWGYGNYEAAEYLNQLPNAQNIVIWSDHRGICQFFIGRCIISNEIPTDHTDVNYLVYTRRGVLTQPIKFVGTIENNLINIDPHNPQFIQKNTVHEIHINNRPSNFIKIIKVEK